MVDSAVRSIHHFREAKEQVEELHTYWKFDFSPLQMKYVSYCSVNHLGRHQSEVKASR